MAATLKPAASDKMDKCHVGRGAFYCILFQESTLNWTTKENNHIDVFCRVLLWCRQFSLSNASPVFLPSVAAILFFFSIAPSSSAYSGSADNYPSVTLWPLAYHYQDESRSRTDILYPFFITSERELTSVLPSGRFFTILRKIPQEGFFS